MAGEELTECIACWHFYFTNPSQWFPMDANTNQGQQIFSSTTNLNQFFLTNWTYDAYEAYSNLDTQNHKCVSKCQLVEPYEVLADDYPFFYEPITFTETVHEATGETIILYDEVKTPQYASLTPGFLQYQAFFACPCAEGYSRLNPGTNEECFDCQSVIPDCNDCTLGQLGEVICLKC